MVGILGRTLELVGVVVPGDVVVTVLVLAAAAAAAARLVEEGDRMGR